jgi:hypothetical protein
MRLRGQAAQCLDPELSVVAVSCLLIHTYKHDCFTKAYGLDLFQ